MIVLDASAVLELLLNTPRTEAAFERTLARGETLHAPFLLDVEIAQALRRLVLTGGLSAEDGRTYLADLGALVIERYAHEPLLPRAWDLRAHLTAYDAMYVALAEVLECPLLTADAKLAKAAGRRVAVDLLA